jgi:SLT domain-containing protein
MKRIVAIVVLFIICTVIIYNILNSGTYNIFTIDQEKINEIVFRFDNNSLTRKDKKNITKNIQQHNILWGYNIS